MNNLPLIFDRNFHLLQLKKCKTEILKEHFLLKEIADDLNLRLQEIKQPPQTTLSYGFPLNLPYLAATNHSYAAPSENLLLHQGMIINEEEIYTIKDKFDLILSNLTLHYVNDVVGSLVQYKRILEEKNGIFIATLFGPKTLYQLKEAFLALDMQLFAGALPHVIPFIDAQDGASLLRRAGFKNAISDSYEIKVAYQSLNILLQDIKQLGQSNALLARGEHLLPKNYFQQLEQLYNKMHQLNCTFEIVTLTGF